MIRQKPKLLNAPGESIPVGRQRNYEILQSGVKSRFMWLGRIPCRFVVPLGTSHGIALDNQKANRQTITHAASEMANPSETDMRRIRRREAPNDCRTAVSRCLTTARASIRLATFEQTISSVIAVTTEKMAGKRPPICEMPAVLNRHAKVSVDFVVDVGYASFSRDFMIDVIASTNCSHRDCSFNRCFLPAGVSR